MTKKNRKRLLIVISIVVAAIILILCLRSCECNTADVQLPIDDVTILTDGELDYIPFEDNKGTIQIPVVTGMSLKAFSLEQSVDFYNPKVNNCFFIISLYLSDGTLIYQSDMIAPDEHIKDITLLQELNRGKYRNCKLVYNCVALDGVTPLNGSNVVIEINSN